MPDGAAPDPMNPTGQQVRIPTREKANEAQVRTVLSIMGQLNPYLILPQRDEDEPAYKTDPYATKCASTTFALACNRLDEMLVEKSRWEETDGESVVESIKATQAEIRGYYKEQALSMAELRRPSRIFHPSFAQMGGEFSAYHASSDFPGGIIIGRGRTPAEAMADFDRAFNRIPAEQLRFNDASLAKIRAAGVTIDTGEPADEPAPEPPPVKRDWRFWRKK